MTQNSLCLVCFAIDFKLNSCPLKAKYSKEKKKLDNTLSEFKVKKAYTEVAKIRAISATVNNGLTFDSEAVENPEIIFEYSCNIYKCIHGQILYLNELDKWINLKAIIIKLYEDFTWVIEKVEACLPLFVKLFQSFCQVYCC